MLTYNFKIKSAIHDYSVDFIENFSQSLQDELNDGDIIIIDKKVLNLYGFKIEDLLTNHNHLIITATEDQKSYLGIIPIIAKLLENNFRKNNKLIAIGGGITQDITAFISSVMYRGVEWVFFPTTLLAQGDSSIGGKTSINFGTFKNQIGNFYPPTKIFIDLGFLGTLSKTDLFSGLGEMCHYFIISGKEDFNLFSDNFNLVLKDISILKTLIERSLEIKKRVIEVDEFDQNIRQVFNYGHSFGHAIESLTHFKIPHGIAVSFGMDMANFISMKLDLLPRAKYESMHNILSKIWQGFELQNIDLENFILALRKDKKNVGDELGLILMSGIGKTFKMRVKPNKKFVLWIKEYFETQGTNL